MKHIQQLGPLSKIAWRWVATTVEISVISELEVGVCAAVEGNKMSGIDWGVLGTSGSPEVLDDPVVDYRSGKKPTDIFTWRHNSSKCVLNHGPTRLCVSAIDYRICYLRGLQFTRSMPLWSKGKRSDFLKPCTAFCNIATASHALLNTSGKSFLVRVCPRCSRCQDFTQRFQADFMGEKKTTSHGWWAWVAFGRRQYRINPLSEQKVLGWSTGHVSRLPIR